jgi:hypothetical protein
MFRPLDRRTFLKASGVSLALPLLEIMNPAIASAAMVAPPKRMLVVCTVLGLYRFSLFPKTTGPDYESTEYLDLLKDHRKDFTLFSGLAHEGQAGRQAHSCEITFLSSARDPELGGFRNSISVDQVAANRLGYTTRYPSVVFGSKNTLSQSFTSSGVMVPAENRPARMFSRMFLQGKRREVERQERILSDGRSIFDSLMSQTNALLGKASSADKDQLDEYYTSVRKAEQDMAEAQAWSSRPKPVLDVEQPIEIRDSTELIAKTQLINSMIPLILQTDSSRVIAVKIQDHQSIPVVNGVSEEHHNLSHHGKEEDKIEQLKMVERELVTSFGDLLTQLKSKKEAGGNLLDNTTTLFGSNLGNANAHNSRNLPIILAGGGLNHGSYVAHDEDNNAPLCNLFLTMLNNMGMDTEVESFGQSTGAMTW